MNRFVSQMIDYLMSSQNGGLSSTQQGYVDIITSGDSKKGEEVAMNLCNSMGITKEQAVAQARQFFNI